MIVKILHAKKPSSSFKGVSYNTNKIEKDKGELMKAANFGPLQGLENLRPEDYKNYLKMISATNKAVKKPQFHAVISASGKTYDKAALTEIATQWLAGMGYKEQPYLIVYHKDTRNNHVHMVSTRIDRDGKKINSGFENIRAVNNLNRILGLDEQFSVSKDIEKALTFNFSTKAQFKMILETQEYTVKEAGYKLEIIKFGKRQSEIELSLIEKAIQNHTAETNRVKQLKAIFNKYAALFDTSLKPQTIPLPGNYLKTTKGFTSAFAASLKEKFGITILFHASGDKMPYGYSVIDHAVKAVFKGSEIMPLKDLLEIKANERVEFAAPNVTVINDDAESLSTETKEYYSAILRASLLNYPDLVQGLHHQGLTIRRNGETYTLTDPVANARIDCADLLDEKDYDYLVRQFAFETGLDEETYRPHHDIPGISIADDVDDQQIHGLRRRRQKKARTNTR
jgi:hypothetical protein